MTSLLPLCLLAGLMCPALALRASHRIDPDLYSRVITSQPAIGDVVFTRIGGPIFGQVAATTLSWTNHVGIIVDYRDGDWVVAESRVPFVSLTPLRSFLGRSVDSQFSIRRLQSGPTEAEKRSLLAFAEAQRGRVYSFGFNLASPRTTFCSKFVHDAVRVSTRQELGQVETFDQLLHRNPQAPLWFWRSWFFGRIPWQRTTVTPDSELNSPLLQVIVENGV